MPRFKLTVAYDGTGLVGWQRQASGPSVQSLLEDALTILDDAPVSVTGAGRTDAGVHALGQVASATLARQIDAATLVRAINAHLPDEVRVLDARETAPTFHPQFQATSKTYRYRLWTAAVVDPFEYRYVWHVPPPALDLSAMHAAAAMLEGRHDFAAFQTTGGAPGPTERHVFSARLTERPADDPQPGLLVFDIRGDGFLRHMVRAIVGTLVEVGRGRRDAAWMRELLASRSRAQAGPTAPPAGLFLVRVDYDGGDL